MRRVKFENLVNLYLDGEITIEQKRELCQELARSPHRRELFESYRRLNSAACKAHFTTACLSNHGRATARKPLLSLGLWGGAAGSFAGVALFIAATTGVNRGSTSQPLAVESMADLQAQAAVFSSGRGPSEFEFPADGFRLASERRLQTPLLREWQAYETQVPPLFPASPVHFNQFRLVQLLDDSVQAMQPVAMPALFRPE